MLFLFHLHQGENLWGKELHLLVNALGRLFTYGVEDVEKERTMFQRGDVQHAVMEKHQPLIGPHGELEIFVGREPVKFYSLL